MGNQESTPVQPPPPSDPEGKTDGSTPQGQTGATPVAGGGCGGAGIGTKGKAGVVGCGGVDVTGSGNGVGGGSCGVPGAGAPPGTGVGPGVPVGGGGGQAPTS